MIHGAQAIPRRKGDFTSVDRESVKDDPVLPAHVRARDADDIIPAIEQNNVPRAITGPKEIQKFLDL